MMKLLRLLFLLPMIAHAATNQESAMLPVHSALMAPGKVVSRPVLLPRLTTLFIIGDDKLSRAWLRQRLPVLRQLRAIGLVVQVETPQALAELRQLSSGLTLSPVSADDLAQRLDLHHYPLLIVNGRIEQ
ncbi:integrating conjugative element protein [Salmonella enterica]